MMAIPFFPPLAHGCSVVPPPMPMTASQPGSRHWNRLSRYSMLSDDDWEDGGMATPLVPISTLPPPPENSIAGPDFIAPHPRTRARRSGIMSTGADFNAGGRKRWSRMSDTFSFGGSTIDELDTSAEHSRYPARKRKRWSNSIGSATTTAMGAVRESVMSIGTEFTATASRSPIERDDMSLGRPRKGKRRRLGRVLKGLAASFRGLGAGGSAA